MINTNATPAVGWASASAPVAPAVPAVMAVAPAAPASRDGQPALQREPGQRRGASAEPGKPSAPPSAAEQARAAAERSMRRQLEAERLQERNEAQRETVEQLRDTLRKVWDASGAVVEQALAQEAERAARGNGIDALSAQRRALLANYTEALEQKDFAGSQLDRLA